MSTCTWCSGWAAARLKEARSKARRRHRCRARIARAQRTQRQRWETLNQDVATEALREGALLSQGGERLLGTAQKKRHLSQRRTETVLRVAPTIADLERSERVGAEHVAEAVGYQRVDLDASCAERR